MAYTFKKQYENQTVILADGTLIDKESINRASVRAKINSGVWFAYMLEEAKPEEAKPEEAKPEEAKPEEAKPEEAKPKKRTRKK